MSSTSNHRVMGTIARGEPYAKFSNTENQTLTNESLPEALRILAEARDNANYRSPCERDPRIWDGVSVTDTDHMREAVLRVEDALRGCRSCLVLSECRGVLATVQTTYDITGVIAGEWVDNTRTGKYIGHYLKNGQWPEEANVT